MNTLKANGVTLRQVSEDTFLVIIKNLFIALSYWFFIVIYQLYVFKYLR